MDESQLFRLVEDSQQGSSDSRDALLRQMESFALRQAQQVCHQPIDRSHDAYSVALLALNETVDAFDPARGVSFTSFARTVIRRRVIDYLRAEQRHRHLPLAEGGSGVDEQTLAEEREAARRYARERDRQILAAQLEEYKKGLSELGLDMQTLITATPRRRDARERLQRAALALVQDPDLLAQMKRTGRLPVQTLTRRLPYSRKTLERGRAYIMGTALALSEQFPQLRAHLSGLMREWEWER